MREPLDVRESFYAYRAGSGHPSNIVATQIDQHDVFGDLFFVDENLGFECSILLVVVTAWSGASDRPRAHDALVYSHQHLGRSAHDLMLARVQQIHIRRGVERSQDAIKREGVHCALALELLAGYDLKDITGHDVLLGTFDDAAVLFGTEVGEIFCEGAYVDGSALLRCRGHETLDTWVTGRWGGEQRRH